MKKRIWHARGPNLVPQDGRRFHWAIGPLVLAQLFALIKIIPDEKLYIEATGDKKKADVFKTENALCFVF